MLIECPECKSQISDKSSQCIRCGFPISSLNRSGQTVESNRPEPAAPSRQGQGLIDIDADGASGDRNGGNYSQYSGAQNPQLVKSATSRGIYIILGLFLGCFGIHNFYAGRYGVGATQLIITALLGWVVVGFVITAVWALIDVIAVTEDGAGNKMT